ncbi:MAG: acyl-CoA thioesterase II [Kistimonas sp.]|nr:acyl-CoA thioesterase II [Kistimonas sp.]
MQHSLGWLLSLLRPEPVDDDRFCASSQDLGYPQLFGGQLMGQAIAAASQTLGELRPLHAFHCCFLRPGRIGEPLYYEVDRCRDGRGFTARQVRALQRGRVLFQSFLSFHKPEQGLEHQRGDMPDVPPPEQLVSAATHLGTSAFDTAALKAQAEGFPIEARPVPAASDSRDPVSHIWLRANGQLPDDPNVHQGLLAYASDYSLLATCLRAQDSSALQSGLKVASLDHAMWFHRPLRMNEWLLHSMESPTACGARGLVRGQVFTPDGVLVASTVQEGLLRVHS